MQLPSAVVTDVDQVLLDYISGIREYVNTRDSKSITGHPLTWNMTEWLQLGSGKETQSTVDEFSKTYEFGKLDAFPGAEGILHGLSCDIVCLTACGANPLTAMARRLNLFLRFGDIFSEIHFVEYTDSKSDKLLDISTRYDIVAFVDDKPENILDAINLANIKNTILMKAPHNRAFREANELDIKYAFSWYECRHFIKQFETSI